MLYFIPAPIRVLIGVALLVAGLVAHLPLLAVAGGLVTVVSGAGWLRRQRGGGPGR